MLKVRVIPKIFHTESYLPKKNFQSLGNSKIFQSKFFFSKLGLKKIFNDRKKISKLGLKKNSAKKNSAKKNYKENKNFAAYKKCGIPLKKESLLPPYTTDVITHFKAIFRFIHGLNLNFVIEISNYSLGCNINQIN